MLLPRDCAVAGGNFVASAATCTPDPCTTGACCVADGPLPSCHVATAFDCAFARGMYAGDGTSCIPGECDLGACCAANSTCSESIGGACGGYYLGAFTNCADTLPCAVGPCCWQGACQLATAVTCARIGGSFASGGAASCTPDPCAVSTCELNRNELDISFPPILPPRIAPWVYTLACSGGDDRLPRLLDAAPADGRDEGPVAGVGGGELLLYQFTCACAPGSRLCLSKDPGTGLRVRMQFCP